MYIHWQGCYTDGQPSKFSIPTMEPEEFEGNWITLTLSTDKAAEMHENSPINISTYPIIVLLSKNVYIIYVTISKITNTSVLF